jgi:hypothetical protein
MERNVCKFCYAQNHPLLNKIRRDLVLLIHRYLKTKYQCSDMANFLTSKLLR